MMHTLVWSGPLWPAHMGQPTIAAAASGSQVLGRTAGFLAHLQYWSTCPVNRAPGTLMHMPLWLQTLPRQ